MKPHCAIIDIEGESYRLKEAKERTETKSVTRAQERAIQPASKSAEGDFDSRIQGEARHQPKENVTHFQSVAWFGPRACARVDLDLIKIDLICVAHDCPLRSP